MGSALFPNLSLFCACGGVAHDAKIITMSVKSNNFFINFSIISIGLNKTTSYYLNDSRFGKKFILPNKVHCDTTFANNVWRGVAGGIHLFCFCFFAEEEGNEYETFDL